MTINNKLKKYHTSQYNKMLKIIPEKWIKFPQIKSQMKKIGL